MTTDVVEYIYGPFLQIVKEQRDDFKFMGSKRQPTSEICSINKCPVRSAVLDYNRFLFSRFFCLTFLKNPAIC